MSYDRGMQPDQMEAEARVKSVAKLPASLTVQTGGDHYKTMGMQPFYFTMHNGWDGAAHSILKYVSRHKAKAGAVDLQKARHIIDIRNDLWGPWCYPQRPAEKRVRMVQYLEANGIVGLEAAALLSLEHWVESHHKTDARELLRNCLTKLIADYGTLE